MHLRNSLFVLGATIVDALEPPQTPLFLTNQKLVPSGVQNTICREAFKFPEKWPGLKSSSLEVDGDVDIVTGSQFRGLATYANLPYLNCLSDNETEGNPYDIAILGAPFDTGVTARPGARYGPKGIRIGSQRRSAGFSWSVYTGRNPLKSWAKVVDCGDVPLTWLDNNVALAQLDKAHTVVSGRTASNETYSSHPRILTLGGDHTTTLSALRSTYNHWGAVSVIHFDSHIDTWDPALIGGGISDYAGLNHGTFLHIAHEEGLIRSNSIHAGIRAPLKRKKGDMRNDVRCGFETIKARDIDKLGTAGIISEIKKRVGDSKVYISVDIDVLDPAFAPATGTPEPGGWSSRELLTILDGLNGLNIIGGDVVEVAPVYDTKGETTVLAAAEVAFSLIELMVENPVTQ
ncbi:arginase [Annulohypoxylon maeteangense]|uniref:arginase n=1 Tax=Annulohypoxylon maeteangense TaxID=1927788 RepID=UPI00200814E6|nr:arginase [Annulohypoxylon maeteangense]KAI0882232.1 arginase [Annulohypoxylon maeteangense]